MMRKYVSGCIFVMTLVLSNESTCSGVSLTGTQSAMLLPPGTVIKTANGDTISSASSITVVTESCTLNIGQQSAHFQRTSRTNNARPQRSSHGALLIEEDEITAKKSAFERVKNCAVSHPRVTAGVGLTVAGLSFLCAYKKDKKLKKRIHEASEHYYYKMLEKLMPISFKWQDLENQPLTQKDVLFGLAGLGALKVISCLNASYHLKDKLNTVYTGAKELTQSAYAKFSEKIGGGSTLLFYGVSGIILAATGRYLYSMFSQQTIYYKELLNTFMHSLDQEQINSIGLETLFQAENDPSILEQDAVQKYLNSKQKVRVARLMREYHKYLEKLALA